MIYIDATNNDDNGPWVATGTKNGKLRFTNSRSPLCCIEWDGKKWNLRGQKGNYPGPTFGDLPPACDGVSTVWGIYAEVRLTHFPGPCTHAQKFVERLHRKRKFADTTIRCGSASMEVHACLLADSPVFEKMLEAPMIEGTSRVIDIDDFSMETVGQFFELWYTGSCCSTSNWSEILLLADKYQVFSVVDVCISKMHVTLSAETVVSYFSALNKTAHLLESETARQKLIKCVQAREDLVAALAGNC